MSDERLKPHQLFDDLAAKQKIVKANKVEITLEEARALVKSIKEGKAIKKERAISPNME